MGEKALSIFAMCIMLWLFCVMNFTMYHDYKTKIMDCPCAEVIE